MTVLKSYKYRGFKIYIRELVPKMYEFWIIHNNNAWTHHFLLDQHAKSVKEKGGVAVIICQAAEGLVDRIKEDSLAYKLFLRFLPHTRFTKAEEIKNKDA